MDPIFWLIAGLLAGAALGAIVAWWMANKRGSAGNLAQLKAENERFREEVTEHFVETARLINQLTDSYKAVFDHLSSGAEKLVDEKALSDRLPSVEAREVRLYRIGAAEAEAPEASAQASGESSSQGQSGASPAAGAVRETPPAPETAAAETTEGTDRARGASATPASPAGEGASGQARASAGEQAAAGQESPDRQGTPDEQETPPDKNEASDTSPAAGGSADTSTPPSDSGQPGRGDDPLKRGRPAQSDDQDATAAAGDDEASKQPEAGAEPDKPSGSASRTGKNQSRGSD